MQERDANFQAKEQNRYSSSTACIFWEIFEGLNDWNIVQLLPGKDNDDAEIQTIHKIVLDAKVESLHVEEGKIGAFQTEAPNLDGYYLVKWTSTPYRLEEARELTKYNPPILVPKGGLVADAAYFNQVSRAHWEAVGYQIPAIKQKPDTKQHKGYPSMITAVYLMKSPEWRSWNLMKMKTTSWIVRVVRESSPWMMTSHHTQSFQSDAWHHHMTMHWLFHVGK
jgi:hypothetical protein